MRLEGPQRQFHQALKGEIMATRMTPALRQGKALTFDVFGTVVDWRGSITREGRRLGKELGVPFEWTWSCYEGKRVPCQRCDSCLLRAKAFEETGVEDPLLSKRIHVPYLGIFLL